MMTATAILKILFFSVTAALFLPVFKWHLSLPVANHHDEPDDLGEEAEGADYEAERDGKSLVLVVRNLIFADSHEFV